MFLEVTEDRLKVPETCLKTRGQASSAIIPKLWNYFPVHLCLFLKTHLKAHFYSLAFNSRNKKKRESVFLPSFIIVLLFCGAFMLCNSWFLKSAL